MAGGGVGEAALLATIMEGMSGAAPLVAGMGGAGAAMTPALAGAGGLSALAGAPSLMNLPGMTGTAGALSVPEMGGMMSSVMPPTFGAGSSMTGPMSQGLMLGEKGLTANPSMFSGELLPGGVAGAKKPVDYFNVMKAINAMNEQMSNMSKPAGEGTTTQAAYPTPSGPPQQQQKMGGPLPLSPYLQYLLKKTGLPIGQF